MPARPTLLEEACQTLFQAHEDAPRKPPARRGAHRRRCAWRASSRTQLGAATTAAAEAPDRSAERTSRGRRPIGSHGRRSGGRRPPTALAKSTPFPDRAESAMLAPHPEAVTRRPYPADRVRPLTTLGRPPRPEGHRRRAGPTRRPLAARRPWPPPRRRRPPCGARRAHRRRSATSSSSRRPRGPRRSARRRGGPRPQRCHQLALCGR